MQNMQNIQANTGPGFTSGIKMRGVLTIYVKDAKTGHVLRTIHKQNTITFKAGDVLRGLIAQRAADDTVTYLAIGSMRFGTGGNVTPVRADTDLVSTVTLKQLDDSAKANGSSGEITFTATLLSGDANGNTLDEVGLFTTGADWDGPVSPTTTGLYMFARQVHADIVKTAALTLEYNWGIQFTV